MAPRRLSSLRVALAGAAFAATLACSGPGKYVWADEYAEQATAEMKPYAIAAGDTIQVRVFNQEQLTSRARVRTDGKISLPLLNDVPAAGLFQAQAKAEGQSLGIRYALVKEIAEEVTTKHTKDTK